MIDDEKDCCTKIRSAQQRPTVRRTPAHPEAHGDAREPEGPVNTDFDPVVIESTTPPRPPVPPTAEIPPDYDPFDPALYRITQSFSDLRTKTVVTDCPVKLRLVKDWWVRIHPDLEGYSTKASLLVPSQGDPYLVPPPLVPAFKERRETTLVSTCLYLAQNRQRSLFLWGVRIPSEENPVVEPWMRGPLEAAHRARTEWVRLTWNPATRSHDVRTSEADWPAPVWPSESLRDLLALGFGERVVRSLDDAFVRELWGKK